MAAPQDLFNIAVGVAGSLGGWWLNTMWTAMRELERKVASIDVLVAGSYVKREEFKELSEVLFEKLDRIDAKLDRKVDKP